MQFSSSVDSLPIAVSFKKALKRLGIKTAADLLFYFPSRYEDRSVVTAIKNLKVNQPACVLAQILEIKSERTWRKKMLLTHALVKDETGSLKVVWFNQPYMVKALKPGEKAWLTGKLMLGDYGLYFANPSFEKISQEKEAVHSGRIVPVYPETYGITSRMIRRLIKTALDRLAAKLPETLPRKILIEKNLAGLSEALCQIHFPDNFSKAEQARRRFQFEEIFLVGLFVLQERLALNREKAVAIEINEQLLKKFSAALPFTLTNAQKKSAWQILKDMSRPRPMNRLLQGDVGSGKTVVAAIASLSAVKAGWQAAFMAPTEILAKQHFREVSKLLENFRVNIGLLTGKEDKFISEKLAGQPIEASRQKLLKMAAASKLDILIGTHALIQDKVKFGKLALVVLDEQHRFGVKQRAKLVKSPTAANKQQPKRLLPHLLLPHLLSMTATPIPRTLALTIYGDLDLSTIDEMPKGRKKVITEIVEPQQRQRVYEFVRKEAKQGNQIFVICPRIGEDQEMSNNKIRNPNVKLKTTTELKAVLEEHRKLSKEVFPELKVAMLHGKMSTQEKTEIMQDFKRGKIDILVSTSVVEVGIDIPNATVMLIEGAERFGLAQLYQFRGRVGRSDKQSYCFLLTESPSATTRHRMRALLTAQNGFELAEMDLQIRGPGDFFGTKQWGLPDLAMSGLKDAKLARETRELAAQILQEDPELEKYPELKIRVRKFGERVHRE